MSQEIRTLTLDVALTLLPNGEKVHTFIASGMLLGADWDRDAIIAALREAVNIGVSGPYMQGLGHGLRIDRVSASSVFVETTRRTDERSPHADEQAVPMRIEPRVEPRHPGDPPGDTNA